MKISPTEEKEEPLTDTFVAKPKKLFSNGASIVKFIFSVWLLLTTLSFSLIGILFKIATNGFTIPVVILIIASSLYLVVLILYCILLRARLHGKDDWSLKETIYNVKYSVKVIKVIVPIILLFNLIGKPLYDLIVAGFSIFSISLGLISFAIATYRLVKRAKSRKARKEKHAKKRQK